LSAKLAAFLSAKLAATAARLADLRALGPATAMLVNHDVSLSGHPSGRTGNVRQPAQPATTLDQAAVGVPVSKQWPFGKCVDALLILNS